MGLHRNPARQRAALTYISATLTSNAVLGEVVERARTKLSDLSLPDWSGLPDSILRPRRA